MALIVVDTHAASFVALWCADQVCHGIRTGPQRAGTRRGWCAASISDTQGDPSTRQGGASVPSVRHFAQQQLLCCQRLLVPHAPRGLWHALMHGIARVALRSSSQNSQKLARHQAHSPTRLRCGVAVCMHRARFLTCSKASTTRCEASPADSQLTP